MSQPIRVKLSDEERTFCLAVCERLGIDPAIVSQSDFHVEVAGGEELGRVNLTAFLPAEDLLRMMVEAGLRPSKST